MFQLLMDPAIFGVSASSMPELSADSAVWRLLALFCGARHRAPCGAGGDCGDVQCDSGCSYVGHTCHHATSSVQA